VTEVDVFEEKLLQAYNCSVLTVFIVSKKVMLSFQELERIEETSITE